MAEAEKVATLNWFARNGFGQAKRNLDEINRSDFGFSKRDFDEIGKSNFGFQKRPTGGMWSAQGGRFLPLSQLQALELAYLPRR